ncbi:glutamine amidotransferase, partial [Candidatus Curtissbacteria bacterium]|nr:glutamine amidotransferase [Candidatus Curtissbacteria bacterium]
MATPITLEICHLYPDLMDTYGDMGNIITIVQRCAWRNIRTNVTKLSVGEKLDPKKFDIYFFGGGQDRQQFIVGKDLPKKASAIGQALELGAVFLSICGGYQLLQKYFRTLDGKEIRGIGLFDAYTIGSKDRMIQNLLIKLSGDIQSEIKSIYPTIKQFNNLTMNLVGFENHSGKTYLGENLKPLG